MSCLVVSSCEPEEISASTLSINGGVAHTFSNKDENTSKYDYTWDFGDGTSSQEISPTHTFETPGIFTVQVSRFRKNGVFVSKEVFYIVTVKKLYAPTVYKVEISTNYSGIDYFYAGVPLNFDFFLSDEQEKFSDTYTFKTELEDGTVFVDQYNNDYTFDTSGYYNVKFTLTDENGVTGTLDTIIFVGKDSSELFFKMENLFSDSVGTVAEDYVFVYDREYYYLDDLEDILDYSGNEEALLEGDQLFYNDWFFGFSRRTHSAVHVAAFETQEPDFIQFKVPSYEQSIGDFSSEYNNLYFIIVRIGDKGKLITGGSVQITPGATSYFESEFSFYPYE